MKNYVAQAVDIKLVFAYLQSCKNNNVHVKHVNYNSVLNAQAMWRAEGMWLTI